MTMSWVLASRQVWYSAPYQSQPVSAACAGATNEKRKPEATVTAMNFMAVRLIIPSPLVGEGGEDRAKARSEPGEGECLLDALSPSPGSSLRSEPPSPTPNSGLPEFGNQKSGEVG